MGDEPQRPDWRGQAARGELGAGTTVRFSRTFTDEDVRAFGEITRDDNPVHSDGPWCELKQFAQPVCHGLLVGSMLCEPGGQWGWLASAMSFRFLLPTYVGDTVTCALTIDAVDERGHATATAVCTNQGGETVLTAELAGYLPGPAEQRRLAELADAALISLDQ